MARCWHSHICRSSWHAEPCCPSPAHRSGKPKSNCCQGCRHHSMARVLNRVARHLRIDLGIGICKHRRKPHSAPCGESYCRSPSASAWHRLSHTRTPRPGTHIRTCSDPNRWPRCSRCSDSPPPSHSSAPCSGSCSDPHRWRRAPAGYRSSHRPMGCPNPR